MRWTKILDRLSTALNIKRTNKTVNHLTERSGKTVEYTVVIELNEQLTVNGETIKRLVLQNPWSTIHAPQINFNSLNGKPMVTIIFHTFSQEKGKIIENQLRAAVNS
jgi:hypothetical protein